MPACPPAAGTPSSNTSAIPLMPPGSPTAPGTRCCTATPSRCTVALPTPATAGPRGGWPGAATSTGCTPGPTPPTAPLAGLLAKRGDLEGLRTRADTGDHQAAGGLAELLTMRGQGEEAERLCRFGLEPDGSIALCVKGRPASSPQHVRNNTGESDAACLSLIVSRIERYLELLLHAVP